LRTLSEIRSHISEVTRETQINSLIDEFINTTLSEINDPAWAFEQVQMMRGYNHLWSFNRRKNTFDTVATTETYQLPRDLDKIGLIRQTTSPTKIRYIPDEIFYRFVPYPTATGNPLYYRLWEEEGVSTVLAEADTIDFVSSSASDTSAFKVSIVGYNSAGYLQSEELSLNGLTEVTGALTYAAGKPLRISKSAKTTGYITFHEHSASATILVLGAEERSPRFKVIGLYPIPSSAITIYLEYFTRIRQLVNDTDVPDIDEKWIWVVKLGALAKTYQYQNKSIEYTSVQALYGAGVRSMVKSDLLEPDYIPVLRSHAPRYGGKVHLSDEVASGFYGEGFGLDF